MEKEEVKQMDRTEFMDIVYDLLKDDPDNNRANEIINAADEYAEDAAKEALKGKDIDKDIDVPSNSALDHIHNVVAENAFNKGYDAGYKEGYERGKADATISASMLAKRLMEKFDDVLSVADVLEELEMVEKGEGYEQGKKDAAPAVSVNGNTLTIKVSEEDIDKVKRVMLDSKPWCRMFYEDVISEAHWIKKYTPDDGEIYECDNCGVTWAFNDGGPEENEAYYCPKCGFKMVPKGEQHETD